MIYINISFLFQAFSDHSDLVSRRMGFIPLPLGILMFRILSQSIRVRGYLAITNVVVGYCCLMTCKVLTSIILLGKACDLIEHHRTTKLHHRSETSSPKLVVQRAKSHPPSRKASIEPSTAPGGLIHSVSLFHSTQLLGSLGDISAQMESQRTLGVRPLFANSTVSLNSLGLNEAILPDGVNTEALPAIELCNNTRGLNQARVGFQGTASGAFVPETELPAGAVFVPETEEESFVLEDQEYCDSQGPDELNETLVPESVSSSETFVIRKRAASFSPGTKTEPDS